MRPAFSLIIFTSLSGAGLGLALIMGIGLLPVPSLTWWLIQNTLAMGLIGAGVLSSTFHLGHPERAWRALTQWRSSWLSREGVLAAITMVLMAIWAGDGLINGLPRAWLGYAVGGFALMTIWATAMIYASLKTVARWHHPLTPVLFVSYAISGGLILAATLQSLASGGASTLIMPGFIAVIITSIIALAWSRLAGAKGSGSSPETATGLGGIGPVRMLMPPHSEENWLQHEMGFKVARKHAATLRRVSLVMAIYLPAGLMLATPQMASLAALLMVVASLVHMGGVMVSRWLFFAEAKHTVSLYYGERH
ncbi:MAG: dimethyl sulfoxide reductase anchor subunit family protein [Candidatus Puniceispirillales bacterium]